MARTAKKAPVTDASDVQLQYGRTGLRQFSGILNEERLSDLVGQRGRDVFADMRDNDAVVGATLFAFDTLTRSATWRTDAHDQSPDNASVEVVDFVESCRTDMDHSWHDLVSEIGSTFVFGWDVHEICYKYRNGDQPDFPVDDLLRIGASTNAPQGVTAPMGPGWTIENPLQPSSKFNDGRLGWSSLPMRSQESLFRWLFDQHGNTLAMVQRPAPTFELRVVPLSKALLFRTQTRKGNPEARSVLRNAYQSWLLKKRLQVLEAIWVERMCGYPVGRAPAKLFTPDATAAEKAALAAFVTQVSQLRVHELMGMVLPSAADKDSGKYLWDISALPMPAGSDLRVGEMIQRYDRDIVVSMLAGVLLLGHQRQGTTSVGSLASSSMTELLAASLTAYLDMVETVINTAVPRLLRLNGMPTDNCPVIKHGDIDLPDLAELGAYINNLSGAGVLFGPDITLENELRQRAKLPPRDEDELPVLPPQPSVVATPLAPAPPQQQDKAA